MSLSQINPLVQDLLAQGAGKVLMLGGYVGQTTDDHIRLYADLSLRKYVEIAKADIIRIVETGDRPEQPTIIYFKITAELRYVQEAFFNADQAMAAMVAACHGCGADSNATAMAAQQTGGGGMPSLCEMLCSMNAGDCLVRAGGRDAPGWRKAWCVISFLACRLDCWWGDMMPTPV